MLCGFGVRDRCASSVTVMVLFNIFTDGNSLAEYARFAGDMDLCIGYGSRTECDSHWISDSDSNSGFDM